MASPSRTPRRDPLAGLDRIDWASLHAHSFPAGEPWDARAVPTLLRALAARRVPSTPEFDALRRRARAHGSRLRPWAFTELEFKIEHQGAVSRAAACAVPFLFGLLRDGPDEPWLKAALLGLLRLLAVPQVGNLFPDTVDPARDYRRPSRRGFHATVDLATARACFRAVEAGCHLAAPCVAHDDDRVACEALALLAQFHRRAAASLPAVRAVHECAAAAASPERRACALVADAMLAREAAWPEFEAGLAPSSPPLVRVAAACACAIGDPERVPAAAFAAWDEAPHVRASLPDAFGGSPVAMVVACLERLPARHDERVVELLAQWLLAADAEADCGALAWLLLRRAFPGRARDEVLAAPGRAPRRASALSAAQRRALEAIRDHGERTQRDVAEMAVAAVLPGITRRDELAAWLAR